MHGAIGMGVGGALSEQLALRRRRAAARDRLQDVPDAARARRAGDRVRPHQVTPSPFTILGDEGRRRGRRRRRDRGDPDAVNDALAPLGVMLRSLPITAERVHTAIAHAGEYRVRIVPSASA